MRTHIIVHILVFIYTLLTRPHWYPGLHSSQTSLSYRFKSLTPFVVDILKHFKKICARTHARIFGGHFKKRNRHFEHFQILCARASMFAGKNITNRLTMSTIYSSHGLMQSCAKQNKIIMNHHFFLPARYIAC